MDIELAGSGITYQPNDDQLGAVSIQLAAFDGEVGIGQIPTPDPSAGIDVYDGRSCEVREIATLVVDGFIIDQERSRGAEPQKPARVHTFGIQDANALLGGFRVSRSRPAETDVARVLAFAAADRPTWITTWVLNANTVTMPAKTYRSDGGWTAELIPDLIEISGKTLWVHDLPYGGRCLHYHILTSGHTCGLTITDDVSVLVGPTGGITAFAPGGPSRQRSSSDLYNDVLLRDQAGRTSSATDSTSITRHNADGMPHQAMVDVDATSQADLDQKAAAFLASSKDERDTYLCDIGPLDATALALIRVGDLVTVTSSIMGLTNSVQRISHMTLSVWQGKSGTPAPGLWSAGLELGAPIRRRARVGNASFTDEPWVCVPTDWTVSWDTGGHGFCVIPEGELACLTYPAGFGGTPPARAYLYSGATYQVTYTVYHASGITPRMTALLQDGFVDLAEHEMGSQQDPITWGPPITSATETFVAPNTAYYWAVLAGIAAVGTDPVASTIEAGIVFISGPDPRFETLPACSNGEPRIGQRVDPGISTGDGTTTDFTTDWPYQPGTLQVWCNGLDWTAQVTETDSTTGDYTMAYPFPTGSTVRVLYRRAT